jgi:hypothetical protein
MEGIEPYWNNGIESIHRSTAIFVLKKKSQEWNLKESGWEASKKL